MCDATGDAMKYKCPAPKKINNFIACYNFMKLPFIFIFSFLCIAAGAQNYPVKTLHFDALTIDDGLSQGMINDILQDHYGFMWFATKDGLNRYDGYNFLVYRHDPNDTSSLADNYVFTVFEDSKGRLWAGTSTQGLDLFDRTTETFTHFKNDPKNAKSICSNHILEVKEDKNGVLYAITTQGVMRIDENALGNGKTNFSFHIVEAVGFKNVFPLDKNNLWLTMGEQGLYKLHLQSNDTYQKELIPFEKYKPQFFQRNGERAVGDAVYDSARNSAYLFMKNAIMEYDFASGIFKNLTKKDFIISLISAPVIDPQGIMWLADYGRLQQYDVKSNTAYLVKADNPLQDALINNVNNTYLDRGGNLWVGTKGYGILKYNSRAARFHHTDHESVRWMQEAPDGSMIVVKDGDWIFHFDKATGSYTKVLPGADERGKNFPYGLVDAAAQDSSGMYWLAMNSLVKYDGKRKASEQIFKEGSFVFPVFNDRQNLIWFGTTFSFCSYNKLTKKVSHYPYPEATDNAPYKFIQGIYQQDEKTLWVASISGLYRFNKQNGQWKQYKNNPADKYSLSFDLTFCLCPDPQSPDKYLWVGTNGGGLNRLEYSTGKFIRYSTLNGLPNDVVYGILSDNDGNLWISTNKGIAKFKPPVHEKETPLFTYYEAKDGLQSNEFNRNAFFKSADGTLFFGGVNGFNYFNPHDLNISSTPPDILITNFKIGNKAVKPHDKNSLLQKPVYLTDKITLNYEDNMISFDFAAMDFSQPEKNLYQYRLDGFDKNWIQSGTVHSATYTNLDPGTYTFLVKGSNSDGVWNETGTSIVLTSLPPWYMTWWFRTAAVVFVIAAVYLFYRYRLQQALKLQSIRNKIASDLHDEIGSNLSNISIFSNVAQKKMTTADDSSALLKKISEYTQTSMEAMSDIVWMINARNDRFENIIVRMRSLAAEIFEATNCKLHLHFSESLTGIKLNMEDRKNFYLIYKEAINNIAKYAACKDVWINMQLHHNEVLLHIKDNGKGFDTSKTSKGNGLHNMHKRAEMLKGKFMITSTVGEGTEVQLSFPV